MNPISKQNIFITGVPRGGTTILGRMIAFSSDVNYLWEPFNLKYRVGVPDYYPFIGNDSSNEKKFFYSKLIQDTINLKNLNPVITINPHDSIIKRVGKKLGLNRTTFLWYTIPKIKKIFSNPNLLLIKDPIGIFLSEYLITEFNFKIIVTVRHPAAVATSRKSLNWQFDFNWWREQEDFYMEHFKKIDGKLEKYNLDFIHETSFHWLTCYSYIQKIKEKYPDSIMVLRHEDICEKPVHELEKVFNYIGLTNSSAIVNKIEKITSGSQLEKSTLNLAKLEKRDAKKLIYKWKRDISQKELEIIKDITSSVSLLYYSKEDFWNI